MTLKNRNHPKEMQNSNIDARTMEQIVRIGLEEKIIENTGNGERLTRKFATVLASNMKMYASDKSPLIKSVTTTVDSFCPTRTDTERTLMYNLTTWVLEADAVFGRILDAEYKLHGHKSIDRDTVRIISDDIEHTNNLK